MSFSPSKTLADFQNSNLVLSVDYNLTDRRAREEPTGEVMPLNDRVMRSMKMGDKYQRGKAPVEDKDKKKKFVSGLQCIISMVFSGSARARMRTSTAR